MYPDPAGSSAVAQAGGLDYRITQVSLVVRDLDASMRAYHEAFGWGPWKVFESDGDVIMHDCDDRRGALRLFNVRWAETFRSAT